MILKHISNNLLDNQRYNLTLAIPAPKTAYHRTVTWDQGRAMWRLETPVDGHVLVGFFPTPPGESYLEQAMDVLQKSKETNTPTTETKPFKEITWNDREQMFCAEVSFGEYHSHLIFFDDLHGLLDEARRIQEIRDAEREPPPTVERCAPYQDHQNEGQWVAQIKINGKILVIDRFFSLTCAYAAINQYFTKEKP